MKVGTLAWDGLLEALRENLIDALFLRGMFSYAVWLARPLSGCAPINATQPANLTHRVSAQSERNGPSDLCCGWWLWSGAACASAGTEHGVVRGADNRIQAKGAVALAAALQGNTTLQTLNLYGMWTARTRVFCGNGRPLTGTSRVCGRGGASGWWL